MSLVVCSGIQLSLLHCKSFVLIYRVVQLRKGVADFPAVDIAFKSSGDSRVFRISLGKRRNLHRVSHYENRSVQITRHVFAVFLEHLGDDLSAGHIFDLVLIHAVAGRSFSGLLIAVDLAEVNSCNLPDSVSHIQPSPRRSDIELLTLICDHRSTVYGKRRLIYQLFCDVHDAFHVSVSHVTFHAGKLRIMVPVHPFVTEHLAHLVDSVQSADYQSLEVKLVGDSHLHIYVESIVVSVERSGVGSPRYSCKYRGVDLEITVILLKNSLDFFYYPGAFYEGLFHLRIYDKVYISLTVP